MSHIIDSEFYGHSFSTEEMRAVFSDTRRFQRWLDIEASLARVQARLGIIPEDAAAEINKKARVENLDLNRLKRDIRATGHSFMPLVQAFRRVCDGTHGEWVHFGPTTQDIQDTGAVLEMCEAHSILFRDLVGLEKACLALADRYRTFPMVSRPHATFGLPTSLGLKFGSWAAELRRDVERMKELKGRLTYGLWHGGAGTMAGLGEQAWDIAEGVMEELGLKLPPTMWSNARDIVAEYLATLGLVAGTAARVANEIFQSGRSELQELQEALPPGYLASTTFVHKRNSETCELVVALTRIVIANVPLGMQAMMVEHERDTRCWRLDWHSVPESSIVLAKAIGALRWVVETLEVNEQRVTRNLEASRGIVFAEQLMYALGEKLGKHKAYDLLFGAKALIPIVRETGLALEGEAFDRAMRDAVRSFPPLSEQTDDDMLERVIASSKNYERHIGTSSRQIDAVIALSRELGANDAGFMPASTP